MRGLIQRNESPGKPGRFNHINFDWMRDYVAGP